MAISTTNSSSNLQNKTQKKQIGSKKPEEEETGVHQATDSSVKTYSCHQCRQRTENVVAFCKNERANKLCSIKLCYKCLLNRYGEKIEEVALLDDWKCPRCRDICNCSLCMKKKGHQPTGILVHTAKVIGFSSVSEMLTVKGHGNLISEEVVKDKNKVESSNKHGKENSFDANSDLIVEKYPLTSDGAVKKTVTKKRKKLEMNDASCNEVKGSKGEDVSEKTNGEDPLLDSDEMKVPESENTGNGQTKLNKSLALRRTKKNAMEIQTLDCRSDISLPQGINLTSIAGIDLPAEDVGHALQFLEFCKAFGKVFDLKKGHPESYLRELTRESGRRRRQYSPVIQFQIELLSMIKEDLGEKSSLSQTSSGNSWLQALEKCISQSHCTFEELPSDCFDKSGNGYEQLDPSKKLRLLNFLCDEALNTEELRSWIDEENTKFIEREKEAKQKFAAAKDKEKCLKQKMQDDMARVVLLKGSLSLSELDNLASTLKVEVANAHTEVLQAKENLPKQKQRLEAVGTEPLLLEGNGHILWSLRGYSCDQDTLLQDIGSWDSVTLEDKWFAYDSEQKQAVEECISLSRKRVKLNAVPNKQSLETSEESLNHESSDD